MGVYDIDSYTKLLLHCDGADASTTFTDSSGNSVAVSQFGNAQIDTAQYKFGGASGLFDGNDAIRVEDNAEFEFGSGDWTIDFWVRFSDTTGDHVFWDSGYGTAGGQSIIIYFSGNSMHIAQNDGSATDVGKAWTPSTNTWYHVAFARNGSVIRLFINGTQQGTDYVAKNINNSTARKHIGAQDTLGTSGFKGWIDEYRISKGIARWTTTFTPPEHEYGYVEPSTTVYQKLQMIL